MTRVLLVRGSARVTHAQHGLVPPYNLACLGAYIEDLVTVGVLDGSLSTNSEIVAAIQNYNPDLVGITAFTTTLVPNLLDLARQIKKWNKHLPIITGGHGVTFIADEILSSDCVDAVIRGEGELTLREIVTTSGFAGVNGVSYIQDGQIIHNEPRENMSDLDATPFPAWHLLDLSNVMIFPIETSRGCMLRCNFCDVGQFWGFAPRPKSPDRVLEEILRIHVDWGGNSLLIVDDNFCTSMKRVEQICEMIVHRKEKGKLGPISIYGQVSIQGILENPTIVPLMRRAGFELVYLGVESIFGETLSQMKRDIESLQNAQVAIRLLHQNDIEVHTHFIVGYPHETSDMVRDTFRQAMELGPDLCSYNLIVPYPGSEIYEQWSHKGLLLTRDWEKYDRSTQIVRMPHMIDADLVQLVDDGHKQFYFRADWIGHYFRSTETMNRWSIHRGTWYTHYRDATRLSEWREILGGYQLAVGEALHQGMPGYSARVRLELEIGSLGLEIEGGQIARVEMDDKSDEPADLVVRLANKDFNRLVGDMYLDALSGFVGGLIKADRGLSEKVWFIRWIDLLQEVVRARLFSSPLNSPLCLPAINSLLKSNNVGPKDRGQRWLLTGVHANLYVRRGQKGITDFRLMDKDARQRWAQIVVFSEEGWAALLNGQLEPLAQLLNDLDQSTTIS